MTFSTARRVESTPLGRLADSAPTRQQYYDSSLNATIIQVMQSDFYVTANPDEIVTTVLGSCIAVCARDPVAGWGGMNHFLLPEADTGADALRGLALRYGSFSIEQLVNAILSNGGERERLEFKVFGGGHVTSGSSSVGSRNADFVEEYMHNEGFSLAARDLRGQWPRKLRYHPASGRVQMRVLKDNAREVFEEETRVPGFTAKPEESGVVEFFD